MFAPCVYSVEWGTFPATSFFHVAFFFGTRVTHKKIATLHTDTLKDWLLRMERTWDLISGEYSVVRVCQGGNA